MTETQVVEVVLVDSANYEKTLKLDNPQQNLTLSQIRTAFSTPISEGWLLGKSGAPISSVARANIVETRKTSVV